MNPFFYLSMLFSFFTIDIAAQKNTVISIDWKIAGNLTSPEKLGLGGPVVGLTNECLVVAGGSNFPDSMPWKGGKKRYYDRGYVFKKDGKDMLHYTDSFSLPLALAYTANCTMPAGIVAAGGENENGISKKVFLIKWDTKLVVTDLPDLPFGVTNAGITEHNGKLYLAGGETANGVSNQLLVLDLRENVWKNLPPLPKPVSHAVMLVQNNSLYILGGRKKNIGATSDLYASAWRYDLKTSEWSPGKSLPYALSAGTGMTISDRYIVLFGGDAGETFHSTEKLIVAINKETDPAIKQQLDLQKQQLQSSHPGFCRQVLLYDTKKDTWKALDCIPYSVPVTTTAVAWNGHVVIPSGEIKAGVRTPALLWGRILL